MFVVAIYGWQEETPELVQELAGALGIMTFEARQRLIGGGPSVVASFADHQQARALAEKVSRGGIKALIADATAVRMRSGFLIVRRFRFEGRMLNIETHNGQQETFPYADMELLITGTSVVGFSETKTIVEKKFSLGKTLLTGGIPMTSKVERQEEVSSEESEQVLYLYANDRPTTIFSLNGMNYDGFGAEMKLSRKLNFSHLISQLRLHAFGAAFDDRLLNKINQVRLLGPAQGREASLDLAAEILARCLLTSRG
ncbi:hypothetical protein [Geomonas propionica]|uniref:Uncharacterized protein n=1 Tax=Geomonas propionica TaxID=2798582 RepID=A0ABS0YXH9_9BACT|nr:hypothetical protein [Geomonas propionica]MBJ6802680.1 hypothetical protein [Geomonas propionica]